MNRYFFINLILILVVSSCVSPYFLNTQSFSQSYDHIKSANRIKNTFHYVRCMEYYSSFYSLKQTFVKELSSKDATVKFQVYDIISMNTDVHSLEDQVYLKVGDETFSVRIENQESDIITEIEEEKDQILTADSTKVSVVKGYQTHKKKQFKISYQLNAEIMDKILLQEEVLFRYYFGPDMVTIRVKGRNLFRLQKMIAMK